MTEAAENYLPSHRIDVVYSLKHIGKSSIFCLDVFLKELLHVVKHGFAVIKLLQPMAAVVKCRDFNAFGMHMRPRQIKASHRNFIILCTVHNQNR